MPLPRLTLAICVLLASSASVARAQTAGDPSGHWRGAVQAPGMDFGFEVDVARSAAGVLSGTVSMPAQNLKGLPLLKVEMDGAWVSFYARSDQRFKGELSADGQSISGEFVLNEGSAPFSLARVGEARIDPPAKGAPISKALEGTWTGALTDGGAQLRLVLTMANLGDGTSVGRIVNLDEGGLIIPVTIAQNGASVTLATTVVPASFSGALSADGSELSGTLRQGAAELPLTFMRAAR